MRPVQRILLIFILLFSLSGLAEAAGASEELETLMADFRNTYGLNEENFSLCYRDTVTGEEYRFNDKTFLFAASTYKVPLNLYYYEMEQEGTVSPSTVVGGFPLSKAHYQSLVWSNNEVSHGMIYYLGNFRTYKEKMRKYFTMEDAEIADSYYTGNYYCTAMMLDALQYLYDRRESFTEQLGYMEQAQPGQYFARYIGDTKLAHKYGYYYNTKTNVESINDVGIIYGPRPFLLAVYTKNAGNGLEVLGRAAECLLRYNTESSQTVEAAPEPVPEPEPAPESEPVPAPEPVPEPQPETSPEPAATPEPAPEAPPENAAPDPAQTADGEDAPAAVVRRNIWWMVLVSSFIFLLADVGAFFWMRNGGLKRLEEKWGDEENIDDDELQV